MFANDEGHVYIIYTTPPPPPDCRRPPSGALWGDRIPPESLQVDRRCAAAAAGAHMIVAVGVQPFGVACLGYALPVGGFRGFHVKCVVPVLL